MWKKFIKNFGFPLLAVFLLWIKATILSQFYFDLEIENSMQEFILIIAPISSLLIFIGIALFAKGPKRNRAVIWITIIMSFILVADTAYYSFFDDFVTIPVLFMTRNFGDLGSSVKAMISYKTILAFSDIFILIAVNYFWGKKFFTTGNIKGKARTAYFLVAVAIFLVNLGLAETERPQLLTRSFDREYIVKFLGLYNYHLYDMVIQSKTSAQKAMADDSELAGIENFIRANDTGVNAQLHGKYKGKNVVVVSLESLQNFVIGRKINGQEITPFLNKFTKESYYFDNFYHQTGQGKTSDAEFLIDNSLFPLDRGAVYFTNSGNTFTATPAILKQDQNYYTSVMHSNNKSFWNRDMMYPSLGYDRYYNEVDFKVSAATSIGWGLKDKYFVEQAVDKMVAEPKPFYNRMITLTNHYPFELNDEDLMIPRLKTGDQTVDNYVTTVRYLDESIKHFIEEMKAKGLYNNTIIVMYGDHYGISENHNRAMSEVLGQDITPAEHVKLQKVPFFIHVPGQTKGETIHKVAGQIDVKPTILNLLGEDPNKTSINFGNDIFSPKHKNFVVFRDGTIVTDKYIYTGEKMYDPNTGEELKGQKPPKEDLAKANKSLEYSNSIIYKDLLRFYEVKYKKADTKFE
ncbi:MULTISPECIES: LTA synthase family protein [Bacillaceae]|uniref:Sulfatase N-terminal domain-containing protein n=1 Tax=Gottfriedia luciferensis TaxID=178774 RepID=A0ABX2ZPL1_9BACI|nr:MULTISPECIES: LTA synthase family protein [Bacillaceae]ODG91342.1 hypothetical protein BED47_06685 [Gottfriedia luciferensis]PGZ92007.1 hypothetical protein COE53_11560 [Bacillus sp. AFS029533]SFD57259.1 Phosphoglycerol transferase MdoB [Bacillus sp. UNCCL81]